MANIAISELQTTADTLENEDLILVSKNDGSSFTSAKMKGSVLKSQVGGCQFTDDRYNNLITMIAELRNSNSTMLSKINDISATQSVHNEYFQQLTTNITNIGNKVYEGTYGENVTLTITYDSNLANAPIMNPSSEGGVYKKGNRVTVIAGSVKDSWCYTFDGWYLNGTKFTTQPSYSYEVNSDVTLEAKYSRITNHYHESTLNVQIKNESNYTVGVYSASSGEWISPTSPGSTGDYSNNTIAYIPSDGLNLYLDAKNDTTGKPWEVQKVKFLCDDPNIRIYFSSNYEYTILVDGSAYTYNNVTRTYTLTAPIRIVNL